MTTYNLTVDVHDLEPTGPVPASAEVRIWRAQPDASGPQVVSVKQKTYPAGTGPVVVSLTVGVAYWAEFTGVRGWETPFLFSGTVDTSIAERWRNGQLDPSSLQPLPTVPSIAAAYAALQAQLTAVLAGAPGQFDSFLEVATQFGLDEATVTTLTALVAGKAPLASPALTGTPTAPTASTTDSSTVLATTAFVKAVIAALTLGTAATHAAGDFDPTGAAAAAQAASLQKTANLTDIASASAARTALGLGTAATQPSTAFDTAGAAAAVATSVAATYVSFGTTAPDHTVTPVWVDTSATPQVVKGWNGTTWTPIGNGGTIPLSGIGIDPTGTTDSYAAVQAALTAAPTGSTVVVPDGATIAINGQLSIPNRIHFGGRGVLNFSGLTGTGHAAAVTVLADHTILDGLNIANPSMAIGDPTQGNGVSQYGILIKANDVLVANCWVDKFQNGIQVDSHGEYEGHRIIGNRVSDVLGSGGGATDSTTHNGEDRGDGICTWGARATIVGNIIDCRAGSDARIGIHAEALPGQETTTTAHADSMVTISGNIISGQFRRGIVSEEVKRVAIVGNSIADPTWWGAAIISGRDCLISGNTIYYTRTSTDNQGSIWGPHHAGIMVYSSIEGVLGTVVSGNTIDVAAGASITSGIVFDGTGTYSPAHINPTVEGNSIRDESGTMVTGVRFVCASLGAKVTGNVVPLFQQYGVYVQSGSEIAITANKLTGPGAAVAGSKAIHFNGSTTDWQLNGNTIADAETGINCVNGANVQVNSNSFTRCGTGINGFGTVAPFVLVGNLFSSTVTTARQSVTANAVQAGNSN